MTRKNSSAPPSPAPRGTPPLLGSRLRQLRRARGLTAIELADAAGIDKAHLSRIENNLKSPSIAALSQLAGALGVSMGHLLGETLDKSEVTVTRGAGPAAAEPGPHRVMPLRHGGAVGAFESFIVHLGPEAGEDEARHAGQEMIFVLSGKVEVLFGAHAVTLARNDCIQFPGYLSHRLRRVGRGRATALIVVSNA